MSSARPNNRPTRWGLTSQDAMTEQGRARRKALKERLKAKRRAKETELEKRGAGERERCDLDADLTCLEELEAEVTETKQKTFCRESFKGLS